jgi:hypothetical protein
MVRFGISASTLTFLLNGLPASRSTDKMVSWPLNHVSRKPPYSMRYGWLKNIVSFLCP